jgi:hypothetical protein
LCYILLQSSFPKSSSFIKLVHRFPFNTFFLPFCYSLRSNIFSRE